MRCNYTRRCYNIVYSIINCTVKRLTINVAVKVMVIIVTEVENTADTVIEGTEIDNNYITLTEIKLICFVNSVVLINIKLNIILITIL